MPNNKSIQILRGSGENLVGVTLKDGQPLYDKINRYLIVGDSVNNANNLPIRVKELGGSSDYDSFPSNPGEVTSGTDIYHIGYKDDQLNITSNNTSISNTNTLNITSNKIIISTIGTDNSITIEGPLTLKKTIIDDTLDVEGVANFNNGIWAGTRAINNVSNLSIYDVLNIYDTTNQPNFSSIKSYNDNLVIQHPNSARVSIVNKNGSNGNLLLGDLNASNVTTLNIYKGSGATSSIGTSTDPFTNAYIQNLYITSDRNKKEILGDLEYRNILDLPLYKFKYKDSGTESIGIMAQDLEKIYPELVLGEEGNKVINESKLIYPLILEIRHLRDRVKQLENK